MKILHLITGLRYGGAEKVVYDLCKASVNDDSNEMEVVVIDTSRDRLADFEEVNINVTNLNMEKSLVSFKTSLGKLNEIIKEKKVDLVHTHMAHSAILMSFYNLFYKKVPVVFTPHSVDIEGKGRECLLWLLRKKRDHDILFSEDHIQFYNHKNWSVLANGIDLDFFRKIASKQLKNKEFTFISVARFNKAKNQIFLLECVAKLKKKGYKFKMWLVGDGELRPELESYIRSENIGDVVELLGLRKDIPELLGKSHVFLLPSKWEGLPISVLEAGAACIPVITTKVGSLPELLSDERGIAVSEQEYLDKLEYAIAHYERLINNADKLYRFLEDNYSIKSIYDQHIALYNKIS